MESVMFSLVKVFTLSISGVEVEIKTFDEDFLVPM